MKPVKCKKKGCGTTFDRQPAPPGLPKYCPDHNDLNKSAVSLGKIKSDKKAEAARENGKKGGRPKKQPQEN